VLVLAQVGELGVAVWVASGPVGRRVDVRRGIVAGGLVLFVLSRPGDATVGEGVGGAASTVGWKGEEEGCAEG
jgi:hypothetical protein